MSTKALLSTGSAALIAGSLFLGAATASAQPTPSDPNQNPFGGLSTTGQQATPNAGGPALAGDIQRGLHHGLGR
jgi:hypothetical protein